MAVALKRPACLNLTRITARPWRFVFSTRPWKRIFAARTGSRWPAGVIFT